MLKTFFVGVNEDGNTEIISDIAPVQFLVTEATGSFTEAGGQYTLQFVAMNNGASRLTQYDKLMRAPTIKGKTIGEAATELESSIKDSYDTLYNCIEKQVASSEVSLHYNPGELTQLLRRVEYKVVIDPHYLNYSFNPQYSAAADTTCSDKGQISTGTDWSIESALHQIMQHSSDVAKDSSEGIRAELNINGTIIPKNKKVGYKIHTSVESTPSTAENTTPSHTVTYYVAPYPVPRDLLTGMNSDDKASIVDPNTIEFDYVYTGKNVDILEFDMKINMGLHYLQAASLTNTYMDQGSVYPGMATLPDVKMIASSAERMSPDGTRVPIPVFFGTNVDLPANRSIPTADMHDQSVATYNMAKHASFETLDVSMKITGNLTLFASTTQNTFANETPNTDRLGWGRVPVFAKVNVCMPANNDDIGLFAKTDNGGFTQAFWFEGYYYIVGIEHVFDDGDFVQNMTMMSLPDQLDSSSDKNTFNETKAATSKVVSGCYVQPKCNPPTQPPTKGQTLPPPRNAKIPQLPPALIDTAVKTTSVDNIVGWKRMNQQLKDTVTAAVNSSVNTHKIPLQTVAIILSAESKGNPKATSNSGCRGLFQFSKETWNFMMTRTGKNHPIPITFGEDPRDNPEISSLVAVTYINYLATQLNTTDPTLLYMGHNLGEGGADRAIKYTVSAPDTYMRDIYAKYNFKPYKQIPPGTGQWDRFSENNGYTTYATASKIRDQIAGKLSEQLIDKSVIGNATPEIASNLPLPAPAEATKSAATPAETAGNNSTKCAAAQSDTPTPKQPTGCGSTTGTTPTAATTQASQQASSK
jgi:hypothetical protein